MQSASYKEFVNESLKEFRVDYFKRVGGLGYSWMFMGFKVIFIVACLVSLRWWELKVLDFWDWVGVSGIVFGVFSWFVGFNKFWSLYFMYRGFFLLKGGYEL